MRTIVLLQLLFLMLLSCYEEQKHENPDLQMSALRISLLQPFIDDSTIKNVNGTWKVLSYEDYVNDSVTLKGDLPPQRLLTSYQDYVNSVTLKGDLPLLSYEDYVDSLRLRGDLPPQSPSFDLLDVILTFQDDSIYGKNTTNRVGGEYLLQKRNIKIIRYGGTKIGQPLWGNMFNDVIHGIDSFAVNGNNLRFFYNDAKNSLTLEKCDPSSIFPSFYEPDP